MSGLFCWTAVSVVCALFVGSALPQANSYPKPQVASATGQIVPDFTLKDQSGKDLKLSEQRGNWILLFFYRGYW